MSTTKFENLFRQQAIDEISTKLNGEIVLKSNFPRRILLIAITLWILLALGLHNFIKIESARKIEGIFKVDVNKNLVADFFIPLDLINKIALDQIINVRILAFENS